MADISYAVILSKNLKKKPLYLEQIEAVIDITGADADPLTLQQIRDEPSINSCFKDRRDNINNLIEKVSVGLKKEKNRDKQEQLLEAFNNQLKKEVDKLEKQLQERADRFALQQKKDVNDLFWARAKLVCRVVWAAAKLVTSVPEAVAKVAAAVATGGFMTVVAIKGLLKAALDLKGAFDELTDALEDERSQFDKLAKAIKELKKLKKPEPVPQSKIDAVSDLMGPYGARLLGVDAAAKKAAVKLDAVLKQMDQGKFRNDKGQEAAEQLVDATIKQIIGLSKNVAEGRKLLQSARSKLKDVSKRAKNDTSYFWSVVGIVWKVTDPVVDMHEDNLNAQICRNLKGYFKQTVEKLIDVGKEELSDAAADKLTK